MGKITSGKQVMSIATASDFEIAPARPLLMPLVSAAACVALADWLFYGRPIGISLALFFGVLGVVAVASNRGRATRNNRPDTPALRWGIPV
jgi:positive regulator of sigma E activity